MMDISDGLFVDLGRLCAASHRGAVIDLEALGSETDWQTALEGGEDYGLLVTVRSDGWEALACGFERVFTYRLRRIGYTVEGEGVTFLRGGNAVHRLVKPFRHFGEE
jgi:thiamine-monophosphate kinase